MAQRISACPGDNSQSVSLSLFKDRACSSCRNIESFYALGLKAYPSTLPDLSSEPGAARDARELEISATVEHYKQILDQKPRRRAPKLITGELKCSVMVVRFSTASSSQPDVAPDTLPGDSSPSQANDPDHVSPSTFDYTVDIYLK